MVFVPLQPHYRLIKIISKWEDFSSKYLSLYSNNASVLYNFYIEIIATKVSSQYADLFFPQ